MKKQIALLMIPLILCGCAKKKEQIPQSDAQPVPQAVTAPAETAPEPAWSEAHWAAPAAETPEEQLKYYRQAVEEGWEENGSIQQAEAYLRNQMGLSEENLSQLRQMYLE